MAGNPWVRMAVTASAVLAFALLLGIWRYTNSHGVFTGVASGFAGTCRAVRGIAGPGDIAVDVADHLAFIAASDRRALAAGRPSAQDGVYSYAYGNGDAVPVKVAGTPADFHPLSISLVRANGGPQTLMAINRRADGSSTIDIFTLSMTAGRPVLHQTGRIESGALVSPSAIAAVDDRMFYVLNRYGGRSVIGRRLGDMLVVPNADIVYFDGTKFVEVVQRLNSPEGAALSPDGDYLYVAEAFPRTLLSFQRNPFNGRLDRGGALSIPSVLDKAHVAPDGSVWIGGSPKAFAMDALRRDPAARAPSEIFRVAMLNGVPQKVVLVYSNDGHEIGGSSVGVPAGGHLLIGSGFDDKFLDCRMP